MKDQRRLCELQPMKESRAIVPPSVKIVTILSPIYADELLGIRCAWADKTFFAHPRSPRTRLRLWIAESWARYRNLDRSPSGVRSRFVHHPSRSSRQNNTGEIHLDISVPPQSENDRVWQQQAGPTSFTPFRVDVMKSGIPASCNCRSCSPCLVSRQAGTEDLKKMRALRCLRSYFLQTLHA